jgi:hypothetical protein
VYKRDPEFDDLESFEVDTPFRFEALANIKASIEFDIFEDTSSLTTSTTREKFFQRKDWALGSDRTLDVRVRSQDGFGAFQRASL